MLELTLKWFFNGETAEEQAKCGLKLSLYALKKHYELSATVCELINVFCQVDEQLLLIYKDEVVSNT